MGRSGTTVSMQIMIIGAGLFLLIAFGPIAGQAKDIAGLGGGAKAKVALSNLQEEIGAGCETGDIDVKTPRVDLRPLESVRVSGDRVLRAETAKGEIVEKEVSACQTVVICQAGENDCSPGGELAGRSRIEIKVTYPSSDRAEVESLSDRGSNLQGS